MLTRIFLISFTVTIVAYAGFLMRRESVRAKVATKNKIDVAAAAYHKLFIGARLGRTDKKVLLNPRREPELWDSFFPGYRGEIEGDENLWRNYFYREFEVKVTSALLSQQSEFGSVVYHSFTGCFDILRRHGADIILLGASDLAQALPPDELAKYFPGRKILACASPTLTPHAILASLTLIRKIYPEGAARPAAIVVGLSRSLAYLPSLFYPALNTNKLAQIRHYKQTDFLGRRAYLNQPYFIPWTWNFFFPVRRDANHLPLVNRLEHPERWSILDVQITREEFERDPGELDRRRERNPQRSSLFLGVSRASGCDDSGRLPALLKDIAVEAGKIAGGVVLFTTPTLGDELRDAPACFLAEYDRAMADLSDGKVVVFNKDSKDYGLTALDFAFQDKKARDQLLTFDVGHLNYQGARKVTEAVAAGLKDRVTQ